MTPTPATTGTELQQLLDLIVLSPRLTEEKRNSLLTRIAEGTFPDDLLAEIQQFITGEMAANEEAQKELAQKSAAAGQQLQNEETNLLPLENAQVDVAEKQMNDALTAYQAETDGIVRKAEESKEQGQKNQDAASIDAIRDALKNEGQQK